jgi:hypothetical protein
MRKLLVLVLLLTAGRAAAFEPIQFLVYGDLPYSMDGKPVLLTDGRSDQQVFDRDLRPMIHDHPAPFVIHLGDLGRPETSCGDDDLKRHLGYWQGFGKPVFYTIGDNDWIDCIRTSIPGGPKHPLERLAQIRALLFSDAALASYQPPRAGWAVRHDVGDLREDTAWTTDNPAFAFLALHIVSSCDGRDTFGKQPCKMVPEPGMDAETKALIEDAAERVRRNLTALREAYAQAEAQHLVMLIIAIQADMFGIPADDAKHPADIWERCKSQLEFKPFCDVLPELAGAFSGSTLLVHGDTSAYCLEELPIPAKAGHKFWRLNAPGDFGEIDADVVTISPGPGGLPTVAATGLLSGQPAPPSCDRAQYAFKANGSVPAYPRPR